MVHANLPYSLGLKSPLYAGQTLASFLSSMGALYGLKGSDRFCIAFGLDRQGLKRGSATALATLSALCKIPIESLMRARTRDGQDWVLSGHGIAAKDRSPSVRVCPCCLGEDLAQDVDRPLSMLGWQRAAWCHGMLHICVRHQRRLIALPPVPGVDTEDFAVHLQQFDTEHALPFCLHAEPSALDVYLAKRLSGTEYAPTFLDTMTLPDALFLGQFLGGTYRTKGWPLPAEDSTERRSLIAKGIEIAQGGEEAVATRLGEIARVVNPDSATEIGLRRVFGPLFKRLDRLQSTDALAARRAMVSVGIEQQILPPSQTEALGLSIPRQEHQSLEQAVRRFGIAEAELRAILLELNAISRDLLHAPSQAINFETAAIEGVLLRLARSVDAAKAARMLGLHPSHFTEFREAGFVAPWFSCAGTNLERFEYFERSSLKGLLSRLAQQCVELGEEGHLLDLWDAASRGNFAWTHILGAVLDGRIPCFRVSTTSPNFSGITVAPSHLARLTVTADPVVTLEDAARTLAIPLVSMRKIVNQGLLASEASIVPGTKRDVRAIRERDLHTFERQFVPLTALSKQFDSSSPGMTLAVERAGVRLAFDPETIGVKLYRRRDIVRANARIVQILCIMDLRTGKKRARRSVML